MYIHNYQILNVLNAYQKQLIGRPGTESKHPPESILTGRTPSRSADNEQRQAIVDQVSADIVDRITRNGVRSRFEDALWGCLAPPATKGRNALLDQFTYTRIDEHNCKITGTFEIRTLKAALGGEDDSTHQKAGAPGCGHAAKEGNE